MSASATHSPFAVPGAASVNFETLLRQIDAQCAKLDPALLEHFRFTLDGILFDIRRVAGPEGYRFLITASLGYLPFSIESPERRAAIRAIVAAAQPLPNVRFYTDHAGKISAAGIFDIARTVAPDFVFYPLCLFLQEARPFMALIGRYL